MKPLRYTLLAEGSSDKALIPIINWLIVQYLPEIGVQSQFADNLGKIGSDLKSKVPVAINFFPCDILFIHRDCDNATYENRLSEITSALQNIETSYVPVIPIKMTESWLFSDEQAIRAAAGNKNGTISLNLPSKKNWETLSDPKNMLFDVLKTASEKSGRVLNKFNPEKQRSRITELTKDFSSLRGLSSFNNFEAELKQILLIKKLGAV